MRVVFIGTGEIGVPTLQWLLESSKHELVGLVTQPDRPAGRNQQIQTPPAKTALAESHLPILQPERINNAEAVGEIRSLVPEVIVVMAYGQILPRRVLEIPTIACLNLHASLLPRHRGAAPIQAAIAAGDRETGVTVMYMDEGLDTGDVLLQSLTEIAPGETGRSLHDRLAKIAPAALKEALKQLEAGTAPRIPQNPSEATSAPKLEREDGAINWSDSAEQVERKIRAFDPWPGTYTLISDGAGQKQKLKIFSATPQPGDEQPPGHVAGATSDRLLIATGNGLLRLGEVQLEGKKRMSAVDFVRGHPWVARAVFLPPAPLEHFPSQA
ncbi:MAG: methionyl-tRNA formyltransferase [Chthoniobacterales bacterium]|nr:methionyl-tRNA formyltransferase [Chthoniobacterales bacterium]